MMGYPENNSIVFRLTWYTARDASVFVRTASVHACTSLRTTASNSLSVFSAEMVSRMSWQRMTGLPLVVGGSITGFCVAGDLKILALQRGDEPESCPYRRWQFCRILRGPCYAEQVPGDDRDAKEFFEWSMSLVCRS